MKRKLKHLTAIICSIVFALTLFVGTDVKVSAAETRDLYCLYNPSNGEYLYTINAEEKAKIEGVWIYQGVVCTLPVSSSKPIYRLYDAKNAKHLYTSNALEIDTLVKQGWRQEGVAFYVSETEANPIYRFFNTTTGDHAFGTANNISALTSKGWKQEGVAFGCVSVNNDFKYSNIGKGKNSGKNTTKPNTTNGMLANGTKAISLMDMINRNIDLNYGFYVPELVNVSPLSAQKWAEGMKLVNNKYNKYAMTYWSVFGPEGNAVGKYSTWYYDMRNASLKDPNTIVAYSYNFNSADAEKLPFFDVVWTQNYVHYETHGWDGFYDYNGNLVCYWDSVNHVGVPNNEVYDMCLHDPD